MDVPSKSDGMNSAPVSLGLKRQLLFSLGQFGWSLSLFSVANLLTYFYLPPKLEAGEALFPPYIYQGAILGGLTLIGLIGFGGRLFDAVTDPLLANLSDRSKSPFGRRRLFLAIGALPSCIFGFLVFFPPSAGAGFFNSAFLVVAILLFYFFISMYCTPYNALICEYGHTALERLNLATLVSVTWALGFAIGNQVYLFQAMVQDAFPSLGATGALQVVLGGFQFIAFLAMIAPIFINERKHARVATCDEPLLKSIKATFKNRNFVTFLIFDFTYFVSLTFIQLGISYYIMVLLGMEKAMVSFLMLLLFLLSFVFYVPVNFLARKIGKRPVLLAAFLLFALDFLVVFFLGDMPFSKTVQAYLVVLLGSIPIAIFGILPTAVIADVAETDERETGVSRVGMYFATRTFLMKAAISVANLLFPSLLLLGRGGESVLGIRLSALVAVVFCITGLFFCLRYKDRPSSAEMIPGTS
jgi:glycoside/pentoside/hexuronide:cation symporter, GPH family